MISLRRLPCRATLPPFDAADPRNGIHVVNSHTAIYAALSRECQPRRHVTVVRHKAP